MNSSTALRAETKKEENSYAEVKAQREIHILKNLNNQVSKLELMKANHRR